ncbi:MAG TPA: hypothetical protein VK509_00530 [Polyangiales bacterium]|nr:hypothetical protein [Polyangiales bacterium]
MPPPKRVIEQVVGLAVEQAVDLARRSLTDARGRHRRRRKRRRRTIFKLLKTGMWMLIATFVLVPLMVAGGFFYGALRGLVSAPLILMAAWGAIAWWMFGRRPPPPKMIVNADLAQLPERTEEWIDLQRALLPAEAQGSLESLSAQLESLAPQLEGLDPQQPAAVELRRLLADELPELVRGYQRVPRKLQSAPSLGGSSPERQLIDGLATIDQQLARIHERLAAEDLRALATHNRYLELKYKSDKVE